MASSVISGSTVRITQTLTATGSDFNAQNKSHAGLSTKNRNIIIGCCVGIGVPLLIVIAVLTYMFCVRSRETDFIDSDGKVVTAYRANVLTKWWYALLGKDISNRYESNSPLGNNGSPILHEDDLRSLSTASEDDDYHGSELNGYGSSNYTSNFNDTPQRLDSSSLAEGTTSPPNQQNLTLQERFYDEHGNEINARGY